MKSKILAMMIMACITSQASALTVSPESATEVTLSNRDVNRIVCHNGAINDVYYSEEKGIQVSRNGKDAFVKFLIKSTGNNNSYIQTDSEFYVVCGGDVYTLIAHPKKVTARTVHLSNPAKGKIEENIKIYGPLPIEEQAVDLTKRVLKDEIPDSFIVKKIPIDKEIWINNVIDGLELVKLREVSIEGVGLKLSEYAGIATKTRRLNETEFLDTRLGKNIISVTLDTLNVTSGGGARVYLVERGAA